MNFFEFIILTFSTMSIETFFISLIGLLTIVIIAYFIGKLIAKCSDKDKIINIINRFNHNLIKYLVQLFGIMLTLILYWVLKEIYKSSDFISSDILLPIVLLITGKVLYILSGLVDGINDKENRNSNNDRFTTLFVLIPMAIIGFMSNIFVGCSITGIILGKFLWFDTTKDDFISTVKSFKASIDCVLAVIIPFFMMVIVVAVVINDLRDLYGLFWGVFTAIIIILLYIKHFEKNLENSNVEK